MTFVSDVAYNVGDHHGAPPTNGDHRRWRTLFVLLRGSLGSGGGAPEKPARNPGGRRRSTIGNGPQRGGRPLPTFLSGEELQRMECRER